MTTKRTRRRPAGGFRTFPKRSTLWLPFEGTISMVTAGTVVASGDLLGNYFGQTGEEMPVGATLGPIRGRWRAVPTVNTSTDDSAHVEALMQLVPEGGRATLPVPGVDIVDAMWYGQLQFLAPEWEASSGVFQGPGVDAEFLTNAMRKVTGNGQELKVYAVSSTNVDITVKILGMILVKLP